MVAWTTPLAPLLRSKLDSVTVLVNSVQSYRMEFCMPKWIKTNWFSVDYGHDWETGYKLGESSADQRLRKELETLIAHLDEHQYTIKAVMPKTEGVTHREKKYRDDNHSYLWGYGFALITGFIVLAQQEQEISLEEYEKRIDEREKNKKLLLLKKDISSMREKYAKLLERSDSLPHTIKETTTIFGRTKYVVGDKKFDSRDKATEALADIKQFSSILAADLGDIQRRIKKLEDELKNLEG
jgi:hypothetical protein